MGVKVYIQTLPPAGGAPIVPPDWAYNELHRNSVNDFPDSSVPIQIGAQSVFVDDPGTGDWYYAIRVVDRSGNKSRFIPTAAITVTSGGGGAAGGLSIVASTRGLSVSGGTPELTGDATVYFTAPMSDADIPGETGLPNIAMWCGGIWDAESIHRVWRGGSAPVTLPPPIQTGDELLYEATFPAGPVNFMLSLYEGGGATGPGPISLPFVWTVETGGVGHAVNFILAFHRGPFDRAWWD